MWHGLLESSPLPVVFYYFEREDFGLLGTIGEGGRNHLVRFSVVELGSRPLN
jgi:hypothetical protein